MRSISASAIRRSNGRRAASAGMAGPPAASGRRPAARAQPSPCSPGRRSHRGVGGQGQGADRGVDLLGVRGVQAGGQVRGAIAAVIDPDPPLGQRPAAAGHHGGRVDLGQQCRSGAGRAGRRCARWRRPARRPGAGRSPRRTRVVPGPGHRPGHLVQGPGEDPRLRRSRCPAHSAAQTCGWWVSISACSRRYSPERRDRPRAIISTSTTWSATTPPGCPPRPRGPPPPAAP